MNEFFQEPIANFWPAVGLALGFPLVLLLLNEGIDACRKSAHPLGRTLATVRNFVAPSLALLVFVDKVLELPPGNTVVRIVESAFWLFLLYALLGIVNAVVLGSVTADAWRARVPKLFLDLLRLLLVALGAMVIYSRVWGHEITGALTALGLGSIVIGLALQEPLGNIVSGLMLLLERPITLGDWVVAGGVTGKIIEINWRSVHLQTPTREVQIIPNVSLYKGAFTNLSRPTPLRTEQIDIGFSYDDPPNRVKDVMLALLTATPGVLADPPPTVRTIKYADFSINYRLNFSVVCQEESAVVRDQVLTRLWYLVRREGLRIPYPTSTSFQPGDRPGPSPSTAAEYLKEHARFRPAIRDGGEPPPAVVDYAQGEVVQSPDSPFHGFALILKGRAALLATDANGQPVAIGELGPGECFGDQVTAGGSSDQLGITAADDLQIMVFDHHTIGQLLAQSPALAAEIGDAIESRRQAAHAARYRR